MNIMRIIFYIFISACYKHETSIWHCPQLKTQSDLCSLVHNPTSYMYCTTQYREDRYSVFTMESGNLWMAADFGRQPCDQFPVMVGYLNASFRSVWNLPRDILQAPSLNKWDVGIWQSMKWKSLLRKWFLRCTNATLEASLMVENMDSPKKQRPRETPYSPPTRRRSYRVSTEWAYPSSWSRM